MEPAPPPLSAPPPAAVPASPATAPQHSPLARVGLLCFTLLVIYASLYPFSGWIDNGISPFAFVSAPKPRYITDFDLLDRKSVV